MKRVLSLVLAFALMVGATGCGVYESIEITKDGKVKVEKGQLLDYEEIEEVNPEEVVINKPVINNFGQDYTLVDATTEETTLKEFNKDGDGLYKITKEYFKMKAPDLRKAIEDGRQERGAKAAKTIVIDVKLPGKIGYTTGEIIAEDTVRFTVDEYFDTDLFACTKKYYKTMKPKVIIKGEKEGDAYVGPVKVSCSAYLGVTCFMVDGRACVPGVKIKTKGKHTVFVRSYYDKEITKTFTIK